MDATPHILAQAVWDPGSFKVADPVHDLPFVITVTGHLTSGDELPDRVYQIAAPDECSAAREGLDRYLREMAKLN